METHTITLFTPNLLTRYVCTYGYHLLRTEHKHDWNAGSGTMEYLYNHTLPSYDFINHEKKKNVKVISLGEGEHNVPYKEHAIKVSVKYRFDNRMHLVDDSEFAKCVVISSLDADLLTAFVDDAKTYCENLIDSAVGDKKHIRKYIFNEKYDEWTVMNAVLPRPMDSVFIGGVIRQQLMTTINDFMDPVVRDDYRKFNIPYKLNVLLHGKPGTGKTSTIMAIASELNSDVAIVQFTRAINDTKLLNAINSVRDLKKCKIIVMEDIDCLFENRKEHDTQHNAVSLSGLLNAMDGLGRVEGVIIVMTTNNVDVLDAALLRSGRVDLRIKYDAATYEQIHDMFKYYFKNETHIVTDAFIRTFYDTIKYKEVTISMLQQHLFNNRKCIADLCGQRCMQELHDLISINNHLVTKMKTSSGPPDGSFYT